MNFESSDYTWCIWMQVQVTDDESTISTYGAVYWAIEVVAEETFADCTSVSNSIQYDSLTLADDMRLTRLEAPDSAETHGIFYGEYETNNEVNKIQIDYLLSNVLTSGISGSIQLYQYVTYWTNDWTRVDISSSYTEVQCGSGLTFEVYYEEGVTDGMYIKNTDCSGYDDCVARTFNNDNGDLTIGLLEFVKPAIDLYGTSDKGWQIYVAFKICADTSVCGIFKNGDALRIYKESSAAQPCEGFWDDHQGDVEGYLYCRLESNAWAYDH